MFGNSFAVEATTASKRRAALFVAVTVDLLQAVLGPLGWAGFDEAADVAAMIILWRLIGFHPLLLPTFFIEFIPVADLLPTWTGCVLTVMALRNRKEIRQEKPVIPVTPLLIEDRRK